MIFAWFCFSSSGNTGFRNITCASFTALSCIVGNLLPATTYYFKVSSVTADKESPMSNIAFATTNTSGKSQFPPFLYKWYQT